VAVKIWSRVWGGQGNTFFFGTDTKSTRVSDALRNDTDDDIEAAQILLDMSKGSPEMVSDQCR
jgi:hypothetical protein